MLLLLWIQYLTLRCTHMGPEHQAINYFLEHLQCYTICLAGILNQWRGYIALFTSNRIINSLVYILYCTFCTCTILLTNVRIKVIFQFISWVRVHIGTIELRTYTSIYVQRSSARIRRTPDGARNWSVCAARRTRSSAHRQSALVFLRCPAACPLSNRSRRCAKVKRARASDHWSSPSSNTLL